MADYFAGEIEVGGRISRSDLNELIDLIVSEELKEDYGDTWTREKLVKEFATQDSVRVTDDQANYGEFPELEEFLVEHKISFNRHSDARYEHDSANLYYRGEETIGEAADFFSTQDGHDLVPVETIENIINDGTKDEKQKVQILREIITRITPLPKIEIV
jgi:hypothetical protein